MSKRLRNKKVRAMLKSLWISKQRMRIFGEIPSPLYRVFDNREHAEAFCAGSIRFKTLESFKNSEDKVR
ncbi:hypothetical protein, partial [Vibrio parahaemolyticus]|uniref:hypothetical protein n=2 Tax=Vibrionaceae TaxID=641 RepID=UPI001C5E1ACE